MAKVSTYIIGWIDEGTNWHTEYFQALDPMQAVEALGIPADQVREVAVVIEDWNKPRNKTYTLKDTAGRVVRYRAKGGNSAVRKAQRSYGGEWQVTDVQR